jgi:hypothetical protein
LRPARVALFARLAARVLPPVGLPTLLGALGNRFTSSLLVAGWDVDEVAGSGDDGRVVAENLLALGERVGCALVAGVDRVLLPLQRDFGEPAGLAVAYHDLAPFRRPCPFDVQPRVAGLHPAGLGACWFWAFRLLLSVVVEPAGKGAELELVLDLPAFVLVPAGFLPCFPLFLLLLVAALEVGLPPLLLFQLGA